MKSRTNFIDILSVIVAVVLFLGVLALSIYGVKLSLEQFDKTCYADSTNGVVENNILLNNDFIDNSYLISNTSNTVIASYSPLRFRSSSAWGYIAERHPLSFYDMTKTVTFTVRIRSVGGQTVLIGGRTYNSQGNSVSSLATRSTNSTTFVNLSVTYDLSTVNVTNVVTLGFCYYCNNADSNGLNAYCEVEWAKVEYGSTFTGYVPKDYANYGYNQGFSDGYDYAFAHDAITAQGYKYISTLNYNEGTNSILDPYFTFQDVNYDFTYCTLVEDGTGDIAFNYYTVSGNVVPGIKAVSNLFYGDILVIFPFYLTGSDDNLDVVFEDTLTGDVLRITYQDSLHWSYYNLGYLVDTNEATVGAPAYNTWYMCNVHYYSRNPVNIYFLPHKVHSVYSNGDIRYPQSSTFVVYSTQSDIALSTFDDGYSVGYSAGVDSVNTNSYYDNGYNFGYDAGYRDGVLEDTDYSFLGLIGAVFDAPVQAFSGLLDFNLLGVNLKSFVLALLSLSVIIIVIKIALGGS